MIEVSRIDDRDCENCKHYKLAGFTYGNEECYACESWNCEFEPKEIVMKIQRKLLTKEQKMKICGNRRTCDGCPMVYEFNGIYYSCNQVKSTEQRIKHYWNEEIEI